MSPTWRTMQRRTFTLPSRSTTVSSSGISATIQTGVGRPVDEAAAAGAVQKAVESAAARRRRIPVRCGDLGALVERPLEPAQAVPSALTVLRRKSLTT